MATPQPRWLTNAEQDVWRAWVEVCERVSTRVEADLRATSGLDSGDYEVLVRLSEKDDRRQRMSELAEEVVSSPSKLSQRIDRLAKAGFVERERCPTDRRGLFAVLTDDGYAKLDLAAQSHVESVRSNFFDHLSSDQVDALSTVLPHLANATASKDQTKV